MTTDCHSPGERRPRNLSVPPARLFKTMARPPEGQPSAPGTRKGIETLVEPSPRYERRRRSNGSARPAGHLSGRRCLQNGAMSNSPMVHRVRRGGQSKASGSGTVPQRGQMESGSKGTSLANAVALVAPVRQAAPPPAGVSSVKLSGLLPSPALGFSSQ